MTQTEAGGPTYKLNVNASGMSTLHRLDSKEACNLDDAEDVQQVDAETAGALESMGEARRCEHCLGDDA